MSVQLPFYLDYAATTPCDPRVVEAMTPYFTDMFGNPGSRNHSFGWDAEHAVDKAREQVASLIGADAKEVIFTSGSTESNNIAIKGAANMYAKKPAGEKNRGHIITAIHEHKAVLDPCKRLEKDGFDVTWLTPGEDGIITRKMIEDAMRDDTILVTIMWANNEIGTINEIPQIGDLCHDRGVIFHTDATQWVGKMPTNVTKDNVDLLSFSGHKIYGPKGVGALYVRRRRPRVRLVPLQEGGGQERGFRSGTLNVTGIVGLVPILWSEGTGSAYAERIARCEREIREQLPRAPGPEAVARAVEHALTRRRPRVRYAVGEASWLVPLGRRLLPDRIALELIRRTFGV